MPEGGIVHIGGSNRVISAHPILDPGNYVEVSVKDGGVGIPKEDLDQIFDAYYTTKSDGQGLGLASVYNIIRQHGGHISVESTKGKGSTFTFLIPSAEDRTVWIGTNNNNIRDLFFQSPGDTGNRTPGTNTNNHHCQICPKVL